MITKFPPIFLGSMQIIQFFILLLASLTIACNSTKAIKAESNLQVDSLAYEIRAVYETFGKCDSVLYTAECAKIKITFPFFKNPNYYSISDSINSVIQNYLLLPNFEQKPQNLQEKMDLFLREYKEVAKEIEDYQIGWFSEMNVEVIRNDARFIVIKFSEINFTGGAHPNSFIKFINFDTESGRIIRKKDIFTENEELVKIGEEKFRTYYNIPKEQTLLEFNDFFLDDGKFFLNDNFAVLDSGLIFLYNNYEIAPYSYGQTELFLPYSQISKFLKKQK